MKTNLERILKLFEYFTSGMTNELGLKPQEIILDVPVDALQKLKLLQPNSSISEVLDMNICGVKIQSHYWNVREDLALAGEALFHGFTIGNQENLRRGDPLTFSKGSGHIWRIKNGWMTAEVDDDDHYVNHKEFSNLADALGRFK